MNIETCGSQFANPFVGERQDAKATPSDSGRLLPEQRRTDETKRSGASFNGFSNPLTFQPDDRLLLGRTWAYWLAWNQVDLMPHADT